MKNIFRNNRGSLLVSGGAMLALVLLAMTITTSASMNAYSEISVMASETEDIANARMIVSAVSANNALADVDEQVYEITYEMLMGMTTLEEFNSACEIEISAMSDDDFKDAKLHIIRENGYLVVVE